MTRQAIFYEWDVFLQVDMELTQDYGGMKMHS